LASTDKRRRRTPKWARLEALETADDAAAAMKETRARARAQAERRRPFTDDE
jgi:hypothetical protein